MYAPHALKGQKLLAQGIALGFKGRFAIITIIPRAMPWARGFWAFSPFLNHMRKYC